MRGTIIEHTKKSGKKSWGYTFFAGRDENGKRVQTVKRGFAKKHDAETALTAAIEAHQKKPATADHSLSLSEVFEEWMQRRVRRECTPRTVEAYLDQGGYVLRRIGGWVLREITRNQIEDTIQEIADRGGAVTADHPKGRPLSRKTVRGIGFVLHGCLGYAVYRNYIEKHPMDGLKLPKLEKNRKPKIVEADEFEKVLRLANETRLFPMLVVAEASGCRRGELCAVTWPDIDMTSGVMSVNKSLEETKAGGLRVKGTKSEKPRDVVLPTYAVEVLSRWKTEQDRDRALYGATYAGHQLVFCRPDGEYYRPKQVTARVREVMRKAGLRRSMHSLRHSHASGMLSKGVPVAAVAERLGHADASITLGIYTHALKSDKDVAAAVWEKERGGMLLNVIKETRKKLYVIEKKSA